MAMHLTEITVRNFGPYLDEQHAPFRRRAPDRGRARREHAREDEPPERRAVGAVRTRPQPLRQAYADKRSDQLGCLRWRRLDYVRRAKVLRRRLVVHLDDRFKPRTQP